MSSMRNAVARRPHRERAQPASRQKWGILEKHKDYSLRAQDYNVKKKKLAQLSSKAEQRNPDEFAFGMLSADKAAQGKHGRGGETNRLAHDAVKLLKTQDAGYLKVALAKGRKDLRRVKEELGVADEGRGKKTVFAEEEQPELGQGKKRDAAGYFVVQPNGQERKDAGMQDTINTNGSMEEAEIDADPDVKPRSKKQIKAEQDARSRIRTLQKKRKRLQEVRQAKLTLLKQRQKEIMAAADQLELQRAKMARTVGGVNKNGVKFKIRERKS